MLVIKISGAAVFVAAVFVGVGVLTSRILFYDIAIGIGRGRTACGDRQLDSLAAAAVGLLLTRH